MKINKSQKRLFSVLASLATSAVASHAFAANGTWINAVPNFTTAGAANGEWGNPANWAGGIVANGVGAVADFSLDYNGTNRPRFSITDGTGAAATYTIGTWNLVDTNTSTGTYAEVGGSGTLLLDNGANKPVINSAGISFFWNGSAKLAGTNGFRKTAATDDDFRGDNSGLSGTVVIEAGRVRMFGSNAGRNALGVGDLDMRNGTSIYFAVGGGVVDYTSKNFLLSGDGTSSDGNAVLHIGNGARLSIKNLTINGAGTTDNRTSFYGDSNNDGVIVNGAFGGNGAFRIRNAGIVFANNGATYNGATILEGGGLITKGALSTSGISITGTGDSASIIGWDTGGTVTLGGVGTNVTNTAIGTGAIRASGGTTVVVPGSLNASLYVNGGTIDATAAGTYDLQPASRLMGSGTVKVGTINIYEDTPVMVGNDRVTNTNNAGTLTIQGNANIGNVFGGSGFAGVSLDLSGNSAAGNDKLVVTGTTTLSSPGGAMPITIAARDGFLDDANYTLIQSGTLSGTSTYNLALPAAVADQRTTYSIDDTSVAGQVILKATGSAANLTWNGPAGATAWNVKSAANFLNGATPDQFYVGDAVTFGDAAATKTVQATVNVTPSAVNLTNTTAGGAYTFTNVGTVSGATVTLTGGIIGAGPITKTGNGVVNWNYNISGSYTGNLAVNAGEFVVNSTEVYSTTTPAALGVGLGNAKVAIGPNGTLINRNTVGASMGNNITGTGTLRLQTALDLALNTADNSGFSGATFIENGRVIAGLPVSLGTGPITIQAPVGQATSPTLYVNFNTAGLTTAANPITLAGEGRFGGEGALRIGGTIGATFTGPMTLAATAAIGVDSLPTNITNSLSGPGGLIKRGGGNLAINNATYGGNTVVEAGTVSYTSSAILGGSMAIGVPLGTPTPVIDGGRKVVLAASASAASPKVLKVTGLTIGTPSVATSAANTLDINNNAVNINYDGASPLASVKALIVAGLDGAQPGEAAIISSSSATGRGIGYAEASVLASVSPVFGSTDSTTLLIRHTVIGDTNLDGTTNFDDLLTLAQNYNGAGREWYQGDVAGYDGNVNFDDLLALAQNYSGTLSLSVGQFSGSFSSDWAMAMSLVPEPSSLLAAFGLAAVRRQRR